MACYAPPITHSPGVAVARWTTQYGFAPAPCESTLDDARDGRELRARPQGAAPYPRSQMVIARSTTLPRYT